METPEKTIAELERLGLSALERDLFEFAVDMQVKGDLEREGAGREGFRARSNIYWSAAKEVSAILAKHLPHLSEHAVTRVDELFEEERARRFKAHTANWPRR